MSLLRFARYFHSKVSHIVKSVFQPIFLKSLGIGVLATILTLGLYTQNVSAKRAGLGRSMGRSSHMTPHRAPPAQHAAKPAQSPGKSQPNAEAPQRNRWLGPIAGLAAGLGIAALLSHLGLGGAMGGMLSNLLVIVGIMLLAYWGIRMLAKRRIPTSDRNVGAGRQEPFNASSASVAASPSSSLAAEAQSAFSTGNAEHAISSEGRTSAGKISANNDDTVEESSQVVASTPSFSAADFDGAAFLRYAKVQFIRMQDSWDKADVDDIRAFTTAEMFAEIKLDLAERETNDKVAANHTHVEKLDAALLSMQVEDGWQYASVQFTGLIHEEPEQEVAEPFSEIWNFSKRIESSELDAGTTKWMLAGIEQNEAD